MSLVLIALETKHRYIFKSTVAAAFVFKYNIWFDRICGLYWNYQEILANIPIDILKSTDYNMVITVAGCVHLVLGSCVYLGLAKICMNQTRSTKVISNQKCMSEGILSLTYVVKIA